MAYSVEFAAVTVTVTVAVLAVLPPDHRPVITSVNPAPSAGAPAGRSPIAFAFE